MPEDAEINRGAVKPDRTRLKWEQVDTLTTRHRPKYNYLLKDGEDNPAGFMKIVMAPNEIPDMKREAVILQELGHTGITPQFIYFETHPDGNGADLYMTAENGISAESYAFRAKAAARLPEVLEEMLQAMDTIHKAGYLWVDVNAGSFLVDIPDDTTQPIGVHIVDAELARKAESLQDEDIHARVQNWSLEQDEGIGIAMIARNIPGLTLESEVLSEQHMTVISLISGLIGNILTRNTGWSIDMAQLSDEDKIRYDEQSGKIKTPLQTLAYAIANSGLKYVMIPLYGWSEDSIEAQRWFEREKERLLKMFTERAMTNITLPYLLKETGLPIDTDSPAVRYMQQMLSPFLEERPTQLPKFS